MRKGEVPVGSYLDSELRQLRDQALATWRQLARDLAADPAVVEAAVVAASGRRVIRGAGVDPAVHDDGVDDRRVLLGPLDHTVHPGVIGCGRAAVPPADLALRALCRRRSEECSEDADHSHGG